MQVLICEWGPEKNLVKGKPLKQFGLPKEGHTVFFYDSSWFSTVKLSILAANKNPSAYFCLLRLLLAILVDTPSCSTAIAILSAAAAAAALRQSRQPCPRWACRGWTCSSRPRRSRLRAGCKHQSLQSRSIALITAELRAGPRALQPGV